MQYRDFSIDFKLYYENPIYMVFIEDNYAICSHKYN
jgi:hypothetical protein